MLMSNFVAKSDSVVSALFSALFRGGLFVLFGALFTLKTEFIAQSSQLAQRLFIVRKQYPQKKNRYR